MAKESNIREYTFQDTICYGHKPNYFSLLRMLLNNDANYIVQLYRFSQYCNMRKTFIYTILRKIGMRKFYTLTEKYPLFLEVRTEIGEGLFFPHRFPVVINPDAKIGKYCIIHPCVLIGRDRGKKGAPIIGDNVFIGNGAKIIGNPIIGDYTFISPGAIITKNIPAGSLVGAGVNNILSDKGNDHVLLYSLNNHQYT